MGYNLNMDTIKIYVYRFKGGLESNELKFINKSLRHVHIARRSHKIGISRNKVNVTEVAFKRYSIYNAPYLH